MTRIQFVDDMYVWVEGTICDGGPIMRVLVELDDRRDPNAIIIVASAGRVHDLLGQPPDKTLDILPTKLHSFQPHCEKFPIRSRDCYCLL